MSIMKICYVPSLRAILIGFLALDMFLYRRASSGSPGFNFKSFKPWNASVTQLVTSFAQRSNILLLERAVGACLPMIKFVTANDKDDMEYMVRKLIEEYEKWALSVNLKKTKYLCIGANPGNLQLEDNMEISACQSYKYLGVVFNSTGTDEEEIQGRVVP